MENDQVYVKSTDHILEFWGLDHNGLLNHINEEISKQINESMSNVHARCEVVIDIDSISRTVRLVNDIIPYLVSRGFEVRIEQPVETPDHFEYQSARLIIGWWHAINKTRRSL